MFTDFHRTQALHDALCNRLDRELPISVLTVDSTKLAEWLTCRRKFMQRHVLGWDNADGSAHLIAGQGWHLAHEVLATHGWPCRGPELEQAVEEAYAAYLSVWRSIYPPEEDHRYVPKDPANVRLALWQYLDRQMSWPAPSVLCTEVTDDLRIGPYLLTVKLDLAVQDAHGRIYGRDYKTTGRDGEKAWDMSPQLMNYYLYLCERYGYEAVEEFHVHETIFRTSAEVHGAKHGKGNEHRVAYIRKSAAQLKAWKEQLEVWLEELASDLGALASAQKFRSWVSPQNPTACTNFGPCLFLDICRNEAGLDPLSLPDPSEDDPYTRHLTVRHWDPRAQLGTAAKERALEIHA